MPTPISILVIDDEIEVCLSLCEILNSKGYNAFYNMNTHDVIEMLKSTTIDLIIMDIKMPHLDGINLLKKVKKEISHIPIIMISGYATIDTAIKAMKYGALNLFTKPIKITHLLKEIEKVTSTLPNKLEISTGTNIITKNPEMLNILSLLEKAAPTEAPVIITGESGTGKELIADAICCLSQKKDKPYIKINCAAIPENLLESEMFGYEKGAFTDAKTAKIGFFESANDGTIFFDEIGDMSQNIQAKMLRVLQEKNFTRIGGLKTIKSNCRIISATNKNIQEQIENGTFREDLYYRLSVITLHLPPLRERPEDIKPLINYFIKHYCSVYSRNIKSISDDVNNIIMSHNWPGNIRELKNFIERAVIFCNTDIIELSDIPSQYKKFLGNKGSNSYNERYNTLAKDVILEALKKTGGVKLKAAKLLNMNRKTLYNKLKKYNIK